MKKVYILLALISVLFSCSEWKYSNGVKSTPAQYQYGRGTQASTDKASNDKTSVDEVKTDREPVAEETTALTEVKDSSLTASEIAVDHQLINPESVRITDRLEDTVGTVDPQIVKEALYAEDQGRKSRNLALAGMILSFTYIFTLIGLFLLIIGLIKGIKSLRARYNTPEGIRMGKAGVIVSSIMLVLYLLGLIAIVAIILVFLL